VSFSEAFSCKHTSFFIYFNTLRLGAVILHVNLCIFFVHAHNIVILMQHSLQLSLTLILVEWWLVLHTVEVILFLAVLKDNSQLQTVNVF
jgi:hypothetical protein